MYSILLAVHSLFRWLVLASLLYAIFCAYKGWISNKVFSKTDNTIRFATVSIAHVQLILGAWLYFISPVISYFLTNFKTAVHERQIRFFGMEHSSMMFISIIVLTIGSSLAKRRLTDKQKFKTMAIWFTIALLIILSSIPWPFSPLVSRPFFRSF